MADEEKTPKDLQTRSWIGTLKRTVREFKEDDLTDWAAALTYYSVLSIFPALIAMVALVGLVMDPKTLTDALRDIIAQLGPPSAVETFEGPINSITKSSGTGFILLIVGLAGALWTASGYVGAFMRASNSIYETVEGRPFWKRRPVQMLVTLIVVVLLAITLIALILTGPVAKGVGEAVGLGGTAVTVWNIAKWPVLLLMVVTIFAILYYSAPNVKLPGFRWITPGSVLAVVVWIIASVAFAFYVANFGSYNKTYGALGGVVTFLVWIWITNIAVLLGAELNSELERGRELEEGLPADREIQLPPRDEPSDKQRPQTA